MAVTVHEAIMVAGDVSLDVDWSPETYALLWDDDNKRPRNLYILVRNLDGDLLYPPFVLRRVDGDERGLVIGGPGILWSMGAGGVGPTITFAEYLSGANKLSNPVFSLNPPNTLWRTPSEGSAWVISTGVATCTGGLAGDDTIEPDERWGTRPGLTYRVVSTTGAIAGRIRLRTLYEGRFDPPNLFPPFAGWGADTRGDITLTVDPEGILAGPVYQIQTGIPNLIPDGEFDVGPLGADWADVGSWGQGTDGGWNGVNYAFTNNGGFDMIVSEHPLGVVEGEQYEMRWVVRTNPGSPATISDVYMQVAIATPSGPPYTRIDTEHFVSPGVTTDWNIVRKQFDIPEGHVSMTPLFVVNSATPGGRIDIDTATLIRTKGNLDQVIAPAIAGTPGRTYRWTAPYRVDAGVNGGRAQLRAALFGVGRPVIYVDGAELKGQSADPLKQATFDITLPSGYEAFELRVYSEDVVGGAMWLGEGTVVDADRSTFVSDGVFGNPSLAINFHDSTAPAGAESVRVQVVVEEGSTASLLELALIRTDMAPSTGADIAADLLLDPITGMPMSIGAGTISAPATIPNDVEFINRTQRDALDYLCNVVYPGGLEYRVTADVAPLLDVAPATDLFTDHAPDSAEPVVLLGGMVKDPDVEGVDPPETDTSGRATEIVIVGAELQLVSGGTLLVTASALVPGPVEYDLHNRPIVRRKFINAGTVDHFAYAQALADDLAAREAEPPLVVPIVLNEIDEDTATALDVPLRPEYAVGDWIYVDKPEAGLHDPDNGTTIAGTTYFPRRVRVLERERGLLNGTVEMLRPDGTTFTLAGVNWSEASETRLVVGDRLPEWAADPQGKAEGVAYLEDRRSRPR